jgi:ketosteroid isomerase-like protein
VREAIEAFRRRDARALRGLVDPDEFEFRSVFLGAVEGEAYRGADSIEGYLADLEDAFEDWHTEQERYLAADDERVVVLYHIVGRGKGSGVPIDQPVGIVWTLRDRRLLLGQAYLDQEQALEAAGLANQMTEEAR